MNAVIHIGRLRRLLLHAQSFHGGGRRIGIGHFKYGSHATADSCSRAGLPGFLVRIARITKMHVTIDSAGQQEHTAGIHHFARLGHKVIVADSNDDLAVDGD